MPAASQPWPKLRLPGSADDHGARQQTHTTGNAAHGKQRALAGTSHSSSRVMEGMGQHPQSPHQALAFAAHATPHPVTQQSPGGVVLDQRARRLHHALKYGEDVGSQHPATPLAWVTPTSDDVLHSRLCMALPDLQQPLRRLLAMHYHLDKAIQKGDGQNVLVILQSLAVHPVNVELLACSQIGHLVRLLKKHLDPMVAQTARSLIEVWRRLAIQTVLACGTAAAQQLQALHSQSPHHSRIPVASPVTTYRVAAVTASQPPPMVPTPHYPAATAAPLPASAGHAAVCSAVYRSGPAQAHMVPAPVRGGLMRQHSVMHSSGSAALAPEHAMAHGPHPNGGADTWKAGRDKRVSWEACLLRHATSRGTTAGPRNQWRQRSASPPPEAAGLPAAANATHATQATEEQTTGGKPQASPRVRVYTRRKQPKQGSTADKASTKTALGSAPTAEAAVTPTEAADAGPGAASDLSAPRTRAAVAAAPTPALAPAAHVGTAANATTAPAVAPVVPHERQGSARLEALGSGDMSLMGSGDLDTVMTGSGDGEAAGSEGGQQIKATWTDQDVETYLELLRKHGRDYAKLQEALPHKTVAQIRNFYNNRKRRYDMETLLQTHGHPLTVLDNAKKLRCSLSRELSLHVSTCTTNATGGTPATPASDGSQHTRQAKGKLSAHTASAARGELVAACDAVAEAHSMETCAALELGQQLPHSPCTGVTTGSPPGSAQDRAARPKRVRLMQAHVAKPRQSSLQWETLEHAQSGAEVDQQLVASSGPSTGVRHVSLAPAPPRSPVARASPRAAVAAAPDTRPQSGIRGQHLYAWHPAGGPAPRSHHSAGKISHRTDAHPTNIGATAATSPGGRRHAGMGVFTKRATGPPAGYPSNRPGAGGVPLFPQAQRAWSPGSESDGSGGQWSDMVISMLSNGSCATDPQHFDDLDMDSLLVSGAPVVHPLASRVLTSGKRPTGAGAVYPVGQLLGGGLGEAEEDDDGDVLMMPAGSANSPGNLGMVSSPCYGEGGLLCL